MTTLLSLIGIVLTILFVVGTHEAAHFLTARLLGVQVLRFSIGFGKTLFSWCDKHGTEYVLALIPLGGYVKMLDETEEAVPTQLLFRAYNRQPFYKKALIVLAGPCMNMLCAVLLYWIIFMVGFTTVKPVIDSVVPRSIAAEAGVQPHQEIVSIDHHPVYSWTGVLLRVTLHVGDQDRLVLETRPASRPPVIPAKAGISRPPVIPTKVGISLDSTTLKSGDSRFRGNDGRSGDSRFRGNDGRSGDSRFRGNDEVSLNLSQWHLDALHPDPLASLGINPATTPLSALLIQIQYPPLAAFSHAAQTVYNFTTINLILFGKLLVGKLSLQSLGGPITIFESAGEAFNSGWIAFVGFLAFLSVSIGVINLLPIPGLDGGHLLIQFIEWLIRRPLPERYLFLLFRLGLVVILFVLVQSVINDILRSVA